MTSSEGSAGEHAEKKAQSSLLAQLYKDAILKSWAKFLKSADCKRAMKELTMEG